MGKRPAGRTAKKAAAPRKKAATKKAAAKKPAKKPAKKRLIKESRGTSCFVILSGVLILLIAFILLLGIPMIGLLSECDREINEKLNLRDQIVIPQTKETTKIYASTGEVIAELYEENREYATWNENDPDIVEGVLASSAFPGFLTPVRTRDDVWADGGSRDSTPLHDAILAGATHIDVICCNPDFVLARPKTLGKTLENAEQALDAAFSEIDAEEHGHCHLGARGCGSIVMGSIGSLRGGRLQDIQRDALAIVRQTAQEPGPDVHGRCPELVQYGLCFGNRQASDPCGQLLDIDDRRRAGRGRALVLDALAVHETTLMTHREAALDQLHPTR